MLTAPKTALKEIQHEYPVCHPHLPDPVWRHENWAHSSRNRTETGAHSARGSRHCSHPARLLPPPGRPPPPLRGHRDPRASSRMGLAAWARAGRGGQAHHLSQKSPSGAGRRRQSSTVAGPRPRRGSRDAHGKTKNTYNGWHAQCIHVPLIPPHNAVPVLQMRRQRHGE